MSGAAAPTPVAVGSLPPAAPRPAPRARIPSLGRRIAIGSLRLIPSLLVYVVIPVIGLTQLRSSFGVSSGLPIVALGVAGVVLAILGAARYILRPTRGYGPVSMLYSAAGILYLLSFAPLASSTVAFGANTITLVYGQLLVYAAIVPVFGLAAGAVTTVEDVRHPGERLPYDFPAT